MQAKQEDTILPASTLVLTPKIAFKEWLKKTANLMDDKKIDTQTLNRHSLAFITPHIYNQDEIDKFYSENTTILFNTMLAAWPLSASHWPSDRSFATLNELFDINYYYYLIDMLTPFATPTDDIYSAVMIIKPKEPALEWLQQLVNEHKIELNLNIMRKIGLSLLVTELIDQKSELTFIKTRFLPIFKNALALYTKEEYLWPTNMSHTLFSEWFEYTSYPLIDLTFKQPTKEIA